MSELNTLRQEIDVINEALLELLAKRQALAVMVARVKEREGLPIFQPKREQVLLQAVSKKAQSLGLSATFAQELFTLIMAESKKVQVTHLDQKEASA